MIIFDVNNLISMIPCSAIPLVGFIEWFTTCYYLKHKFLEIYRKIALSVKYDNKRLLMAAIVEHHYWEIQTSRLNHFFRCMTFIIYYIGTLPTILFIYMLHHPDATRELKIPSLLIVISAYSIIFSMNAMSTWISKAAHKPLSLLFSYISTRNIRFSTSDRLRVQAFIERLCGPAIGYYCYDLFPMNTYELYQYLYFSGSNYLLCLYCDYNL